MRSSTLLWAQLYFPSPLEVDVVVEVLERIATAPGLGTLVFESRGDGHGVRYLVGAQPDRADAVERLLRDLIPGLATTAPKTRRTPVRTAGRVTMRHPSLALTTDRLTAVARSTLAALAGARRIKGAELVLQVIIGERVGPSLVGDRPTDPKQRWLDVILGGTRTADRSTVASMRASAARHGARVAIRVGVTATAEGQRRNLLLGLFGALRVAETAGTRLHLTLEAPQRLSQARHPWRYPLQLSAVELAGLLGWPLGAGPFPGLPSPHPTLLPPPSHLVKTDRVIAQATAPGHDEPLGIPIRDACRHTLFMGPTGSGKSTAMLRLIEADMQAGRSVLVIDPKTDLARDVLARVPEHRKNDVVVIDPLDAAPVGLNPLQSAGRHPELVVDSILATFKQLFASSWGVRTEDVLSAALLSLARTDGANLLWLPSILTNQALRRKLLRQGGDPFGTDQFWAGFDAMSAEQQAQVIGPVLNKLRQFLLRPQLRAVLGQADPAFNLADLFRQRRIVVVSLNKGIIGAEATRLLGSLIVSGLWPLILARATVPVERRHVVSLYLDEFGSLLNLPGDIAEALAQSRSMGVAWHLAAQYREQLTPALRAAVDANVANRVIFGLNAGDAHDYARTAPDLAPEDFILLPRFGAYLNLIQDGNATGWMSAQTLPPTPETSDPIEMRTLSQQRYGQAAADTDREALTILGYPTADKRASIARSDPEDEAPIGRRRRP